ncbi:MAG: DUF4465 domain-containing protein [Sphingobacteriales bacterium]|nr:MAG: DUF4465 domain-containing protein [Sphingobacteriales bacterium]
MQQKFTLLFFALLLSIAGINAQTVAKFDTLMLPKADTFYANETAPGKDVGFDDGLAHFPCVYDTGWGMSFWSNGFSYSNMRDTTTRGYMNDHSAITVKGYDTSSQYAIAYGITNKIHLKGKAKGQPVNGFFITNTTYAYHSMKEGDFVAKKFGDTSANFPEPTGNYPDWFKVTIKGYRSGSLTTDSVDVYLADFRFTDNSKDTILNGWKWVNLLSLGKVDSLQFVLSSSDTGMFGMNTPSYFAMDNFETFETSNVRDVNGVLAAKVYPNPATTNLFIEAVDNNLKQVSVIDATGRVIATQPITEKITNINVATWAPGVYMLQLTGEGQPVSTRFVKQ